LARVDNSSNQIFRK